MTHARRSSRPTEKHGHYPWFFTVKNAPGPFRLTKEVVNALDRHGNRFVIELTVQPDGPGEELLGHSREFKLPFEVALLGATTKYGHHIEQPRNVRLLGRFLINSEVQKGHNPLVRTEACPTMDECRWEVVFNPQDRKGFVARLKEPLPKTWTM